MNLSQLNYFINLAKTENMKKTSEELFVSQPTLSQSIQSLEKELNTQLFDRVGKRIRLNKYGRQFLYHVEKGLFEIEQGKQSVFKMTNPTYGQIDIGFIYSLGAKFVPNLISSFSINHLVTFHCNQKGTKPLLEELQSGKYDIVFCTEKHAKSEIDFIPLCNQEVIFIVSKGHPLSTKNNLKLEDIISYNIITFNSDSSVRPLIEQYFQEKKLRPNICYEVMDDVSLISMVSENLGVGITPISNILKKFDVKKLTVEDWRLNQTIFLATNRNMYQSQLTTDFIDFITTNKKQLRKFI